MRSVSAWFAGLALGLAACSNSGGMSGMEKDTDALGGHLEDIRTETEVHSAAVDAATNLSAVTSEETRHHGVLEDHTDLMDGIMEHMGSCHDGMGNPPDTAPMHDGVEQMLEECLEHIAIMGSAGNMSDAMNEEVDHQFAMDSMLDAMETMQGGMMGGAGEYDCSGGMM